MDGILQGFFNSAVRAIATGIAGYIVASGVSVAGYNQDMLTTAIEGTVIFAGALAWSWWEKKSHITAANVAIVQAAQTGKVPDATVPTAVKLTGSTMQ